MTVEVFNTYVVRGQRNCRACRRAQVAAFYKKHPLYHRRYAK